MTIRVKNLNFFYGSSQALFDINLEANEGDTVVLLGPSGAGKSTLIRTLNLLEVPKSGELSIANNDFNLSNAMTNPKAIRQLRQDVGMVFQQYHLWPHLTVIENLIEAPMKVRGVNENEAKADAMELLKRLRLEQLADRFPLHLSGGQQQRAFLAMTLAQDAELVLLDEPTTYLDLNRQAELMGMMRQMQQNGKTVITVLHDLNQACRYCDHLIVMKKGAVMAQGTPDEVMTEELLKDVFDLDVIIHRDPISDTPMFILK